MNYSVNFSYGINVEAEDKDKATQKAFKRWDEDAPRSEEMNIETAAGEDGFCPKCGSSELDYKDTEMEDGQIAHIYTCEKCKFEGIEWYSKVFAGHTDKNGNFVK